ncbi:MAG TPA: ATP phosphoribosyltransferase regulatory subunit [Hyphomicrobiales bacterium]|nr:ATP phosphoribosyltransferase regulatory subunit [Hyphomicrobiales bacterium]
MNRAAPPTPDDLIQLLAGAGYRRVLPNVLYPASVFLDLSGEDLRRRMYLTTDAEGNELCLRPDLTIPTALLHLAGSNPAAEAAYCYLGPVYRFRQNAPGEFVQAGLESFGRADREAADAEVMARAAEVVARWGVAMTEVRIGDLGLFAAMLDALKLPPVWRRRLQRDAAREGGLSRDLAMLTGPTPSAENHTALLATLDGTDPRAARAVVEDLLSIAGIAAVGGRTAGEIADRFLEKARLAAVSSLPIETCDVLRRYLGIAGTPATCAADIRNLIRDNAGLAADAGLAKALDAFERRTQLLADRGFDTTAMHAATAFGRRLDYYTGLVFEFHAEGRSDLGPLAGGGRYDGLLQTLGAPAPVPAVGCAVWMERLEEARP